MKANIVDLGAAILVSVGEQICVFQMCLFKYMLKSILIIERNNMRHLKHLERISGSHEMKSIVSLNDKTVSIQGYQTFFLMCIYTIHCDLLISYFMRFKTYR